MPYVIGFGFFVIVAIIVGSAIYLSGTLRRPEEDDQQIEDLRAIRRWKQTRK